MHHAFFPTALFFHAEMLCRERTNPVAVGPAAPVQNDRRRRLRRSLGRPKLAMGPLSLSLSLPSLSLSLSSASVMDASGVRRRRRTCAPPAAARLADFVLARSRSLGLSAGCISLD